jgi:hypothetical protein
MRFGIQRSFSVILTLLFLAGFVFGPVTGHTAGKEPGALARVEVTGMLDALNLPVYAHLQGADGSDYALVIATPSQIKQSGAAFKILNIPGTPAAGKNFLIALDRKEGAYEKAVNAIDVLHDDGRQIIVQATPKEAEVLAGLGFQIAWFPKKPLNLEAPPAMIAETLLGYDPVVAEQIAKVQSSEVNLLCGNLSGENTVQIGGANTKITTRNTNNADWQTRSTQ